MIFIPSRFIGGVLLCCVGLLSSSAHAGGISLGGSRIVYPTDARQVTFSLRNNSDSSTYLIQSWFEKPDGTRTSDFIATPPLYTSSPGNENILRIISAGVPEAINKESLYYFNVKVVPSVDKKSREKQGGTLVVATQMQVKLFVRPAGLKPAREKAADMLVFSRQGTKLTVRNPTPYYLTLTDLTVGGKTLADIMVPPQGSESVSLPTSRAGTITWSSINDHGGVDKGISTLHVR